MDLCDSVIASNLFSLLEINATLIDTFRGVDNTTLTSKTATLHVAVETGLAFFSAIESMVEGVIDLSSAFAIIKSMKASTEITTRSTTNVADYDNVLTTMKARGSANLLDDTSYNLVPTIVVSTSTVTVIIVVVIVMSKVVLKRHRVKVLAHPITNKQCFKEGANIMMQQKSSLTHNIGLQVHSRRKEDYTNCDTQVYPLSSEENSANDVSHNSNVARKVQRMHKQWTQHAHFFGHQN